MKRFQLWWLIAGLMFQLAGCGSQGSAPSAGISATPLNGTTGIAATEGVQLKVSGSLDQASVTGAAATFEGGTATVAGKVAYDPGSGVISITPARRLDNGGSYRLTLAGVRDGEGNALAATVVAFTTNKNAATKDYSYFYIDGSLMFVTAKFFDTQGRNVQNVSSYSAGNDGLWFTADDNYSINVVRNYDAAGTEARQTLYIGPGPDGVWMTNDDSVSSGLVMYYDDKGNLIRSIASSSPGFDGMLFTADDQITSASESTYDAMRNLTRYASYSGPGPDGLWFTADDSVSSYSSNAYAPDGSWSRSASFLAPGADGTWFTADDFSPSDTYTTYERDPLGSVIREIIESRAMSTMTRSYKSYIYDDMGNCLRSVSYKGEGPDGIWFTADDVVSSYTDTTYDAKGNRILSLYHLEPGPDGIWFTGDDLVASRIEYDTTN